MHGLGGAKENFYAAFQSFTLADCTLLAFDNRGTGLAEFDPAVCPDVGALADIAQLVTEKLMPKRYFICAASMGGLIALLKIRCHGAMNTDARAYYTFSDETVRESDSGKLIEEFLALDVPRLFLYGEVNRKLSYLERLHASPVEVAEIPRAAHFLFYDNPVETFNVIGDFLHRHQASQLVSGDPHRTEA